MNNVQMNNQNVAKVQEDSKSWHQIASGLRNSCKVSELVGYAQEAINVGVYNKDFGLQAAGIIDWYRNELELTPQQIRALSYFVVPYLQQKAQPAPVVDAQWKSIEDAILAIQNGLVSAVQVTDRTRVVAVHGGVQVNIQSRYTKVLL